MAFLLSSMILRAEAAPLEREPEVGVMLVLPDGARARIEGLPDAVGLTGEVRHTLPPGDWTVLLDLEGGSRHRCPLQVEEARPDRFRLVTIADPVLLGEHACERVRDADPTWRPDLYLVERGGAPYNAGLFHVMSRLARERQTTPQPDRILVSRDRDGRPGWVFRVPAAPIVAAPEVRSVRHRAPFLRAELSEAGARALCDATRSASDRRVAWIVDDVVVGIAPLDTQVQCSGAVSVLAPGDEPPIPAAPTMPVRRSPWPMSSAKSPLLAEIPADEDDLGTLGRWMEERLNDPFERTKLVHDFIIDRIRYDHASADGEHRAPQDADTVLRTGTGVCAGYANLSVALGQAAGLEVVKVTGLVRLRAGEGAEPHAWNAVRIDGDWFLFDVTWDDGARTDATPAYGTGYLFPPPEVFALSHRAHQPAWQLLDPPLSEEAFLAQPLVRPMFHAAGLTLARMPEVGIDGAVVLRLGNPQGADVIAERGPMDGDRARCEVAGDREIEVTCRDGGGPVLLWAVAEGWDSAAYVGALEVGVGGPPTGESG
jgi:hypothetical protein